MKKINKKLILFILINVCILERLVSEEREGTATPVGFRGSRAKNPESPVPVFFLGPRPAPQTGTTPPKKKTRKPVISLSPRPLNGVNQSLIRRQIPGFAQNPGFASPGGTAPRPPPGAPGSPGGVGSPRRPSDGGPSLPPVGPLAPRGGRDPPTPSGGTPGLLPHGWRGSPPCPAPQSPPSSPLSTGNRRAGQKISENRKIFQPIPISNNMHR